MVGQLELDIFCLLNKLWPWSHSYVSIFVSNVHIVSRDTPTVGTWFRTLYILTYIGKLDRKEKSQDLSAQFSKWLPGALTALSYLGLKCCSEMWPEHGYFSFPLPRIWSDIAHYCRVIRKTIRNYYRQWMIFSCSHFMLRLFWLEKFSSVKNNF